MLQSFPAISRPDAHTLILGSMPGKDSLEAGRYYAHKRNGFWAIMGEIFGAAPALPYEQRLQILLKNNIAVWDVIRNCRRKTSLDNHIEEASIMVNDIAGFVNQHRKIMLVCFNGVKAEQTFKRYIGTQEIPASIRFRRLPSTSPANARLNFRQKLALWQEALRNDSGQQTRRADDRQQNTENR